MPPPSEPTKRTRHAFWLILFRSRGIGKPAPQPPRLLPRRPRSTGDAPGPCPDRRRCLVAVLGAERSGKKDFYLPSTRCAWRDQRQQFLYIFARRRVGYAGDATHAMPANRRARLIKRRSRKMGSDSDPHFRDTGTEMDWDSKNCAPSHSHTRAAGRRDHPPTTHHTTPAPYCTLNPQGQRERHAPRNAPVLSFCSPSAWSAATSADPSALRPSSCRLCAGGRARAVKGCEGKAQTRADKRNR